MLTSGKFIVWVMRVDGKINFYTDKKQSLMTEDFSDATILEPHFDVWHMVENQKAGRFKVYHATMPEIVKWKLQNEVPSDRL